MRRRLWICLGILVLLILLPCAIYSSFPIWGAVLLEDQLTKQGFTNVIIELGHPNLRSLEIHKVVLTKHFPGESLTVTFRRVSLLYQISELSDGAVRQIIIADGSVEATPRPSAQAHTLPSSMAPPTVQALLSPIPVLPFQELVFRQLSLRRPQNPEPFQQLVLSGSVSHENGTLSGRVTMEGPHFPLYQLDISGMPMSDIKIDLRALRPSSIPVFSLHTSLQKIEKVVHIRGSLTTDLNALSSFASLLWPIDHELQQTTGNLTAEWRASLPQQVTLDADIRTHIEAIEGKMELQMSLPQWKSFGSEISATMNGSFVLTDGLLTWTLSEQSRASALVNLAALDLPEQARALLPLSNHRLLIDLPQTVLGQMDTRSGSSDLKLTGQVRAQFRITELPLYLECSLSELAGTFPSDFTGHGTFRLSGRLSNLTHDTSSMKRTSFDLSGSTSLTKENLQLAVKPRSSLKAMFFQTGDLSVPSFNVDIREPLKVTYQLRNKSWEVEPTVIQFRMPSLVWKDTDLTLDGGKVTLKSIEGNSRGWETNGELIVLGLSTTKMIKDFTPPTTNWKVNFSGNPSTVRLQFLTQTSDKLVSIFGQSFLDSSNRTGWAKIKSSPLSFGPSSFVLSKLIQPWPYPFNITAGEASASAEISWGPEPESETSDLTIQDAETTIDLQHLTGHYGNVILSDLSTTLTVSGLSSWSMPRPATLTLKQIHSGLIATDLTMNFQLQQNPSSSFPILKIPDMSFHTLGALVTSRDVLFDDARPESSFILRVEHLDLKEIFKLEQQEDLHGSGLLDGTLPISLSKTAIEVRKGKIEARPPGGVIQFHPSEGTGQALSRANVNMDVVLQALSNFQYDILDIGVDYQHDGTLTLQTRLEGKNPDFKKGKPIQFNLNIEESIPALLTSLQIASGIEEQIEHMIQYGGLRESKPNPTNPSFKH